MKRILQGIAFATAMVTAGSAFAASAMVTADLNIRTGPSTHYRVITAIPDRSLVDVRGCTRGYGWCRVEWNGYQGWAASSYLARRTGGSFSSNAASIGVPLIAGAVIGGVIADGFGHHHSYRHHGYRHHHRRGWRHHWQRRHYRHGHHHHWRHHR